MQYLAKQKSKGGGGGAIQDIKNKVKPAPEHTMKTKSN
jgi:hypothetical protein